MSDPKDTHEKEIRLTPAQWAEAVALWELGQVTLRDLSAKFGISEPSLSAGLKKRGAVKGSRAHEIGKAAADAAAKAAITEAEDQAEKRKRRIVETKERHYEYADSLAKLIMKEIVDTVRAGKPVGVSLKSIQALRLAAAGLKDIRAERYAILDVDAEIDQDQLPELTIRELTQDEVEKMRSADDADILSLLPPEIIPEPETVVEDEGDEDTGA